MAHTRGCIGRSIGRTVVSLEKMIALRLHTMAQSCQRFLENPESSRLTAEEIVGLSVDADSKYSMHSVFFELHKLKKAIWKGKTCLTNEITKAQRILFEQLNIQ